ncbi:Bug family tripartite tricarboxylate transporter substrate binding protein [Rhodovarius lipocyclicus]|uniref:Bug family tripartite tricarboxylate transporter substrate binding protein n=1 Tax=Rhodovarius lipocyclicus TaxID=268410 RepID=UPI0019171C42
MIFPRRALLGAPLLAFPALGPALAQEGYPSRPIRYVSPYPPGATNDNTSRLMSRALTQRLGVPVVVENRAGAGGSVGSRLVSGANTTALVGTPEEVADALADYAEIGVSTFLIRGFDPLEDAVEYGHSLLRATRAAVRARGLKHALADASHG